jgi:hypothetical protein
MRIFRALACVVGVALILAAAPMWPIHCCGCRCHLYRATGAELILSPPSVSNPVCWPCLVNTALVRGDGESVESMRTWLAEQESIRASSVQPDSSDRLR